MGVWEITAPKHKCTKTHRNTAEIQLLLQLIGWYASRKQALGPVHPAECCQFPTSYKSLPRQQGPDKDRLLVQHSFRRVMEQDRPNQGPVFLGASSDQIWVKYVTALDSKGREADSKIGGRFIRDNPLVHQKSRNPFWNAPSLLAEQYRGSRSESSQRPSYSFSTCHQDC